LEELFSQVNTVAVPATSATAMSWVTVSAPHQAATGTLAYTSSEIASQASMTGLGGSRSIHAPAGTPMMTQGIQAIAVSRVTVNVLACKVSMATSGTTMTVTELPASLMLSPVQNSAKFRCRHRPPRWPPGWPPGWSSAWPPGWSSAWPPGRAGVRGAAVL